MEKKIKCNYCDKYFTSRHSKCNHIKLKHFEKHCKEKTNENIFCKFCNNKFITNDSLIRHETKYCKKNPIIKKIQTQQNPTSITNNITNNDNKTIIVNNIINNNQKIIINTVKNANVDLKLLDICNIFDEQFNMIIKLIETTYFNPKLEENHSFYVSNLKGEHVNLIDNDSSISQLKKYFFDELFGIILERIKQLYSKYKNRLFEIPKQIEIQEKIYALENMRNENNNTYKSYLKLINILAYNNKELILSTWTKQKQKQLENVIEPDEIIWDDDVNIDDIKL